MMKNVINRALAAEKKLSIILLTLLCVVGTAYATANWEPKEQYCKFSDNFVFDHAFQFYNAGSADNQYDNGVGFQECPGVIACSMMCWDRYVGPGKNYGLKWAEVYLTASGKSCMRIAGIYFTEVKSGGNGKDSYEKECNFEKSSPSNQHGCKVYCVQKRQYQKKDDGYACE